MEADLAITIKIVAVMTAAVFVIGMVVFFRSGPRRWADCLASFAAVLTVTLHIVWLAEADEILPFQAIAAAFFFCMGVLLFFASILTHGPERPGAVFGGLLPTTLVMSGPYRVIRHPIYASYILGFLGSSLVGWHWLLFGTTAGLFFVYNVAARQEEQAILRSPLFAEEYAAYVRRTWRWFPFIW
jgi:protein-S-isoprenylcysteine O-methyltransferase Ste14